MGPRTPGSRPLRDARERNVEHVVLPEHVVDHLVHVRQVVAAVWEMHADLTVVVEQRFKVLVDLKGATHEAHVEGA